MQQTERITDEKLMSNLLDGELDAAAVLFRRYRNGLFGYFIRMGSSRHQAADLVQEVFERLIRYKSSYHIDAPFKTWVFRIARNTWINRINKQTTLQTEDITMLEDRADTLWQEREDQLLLLEQALIQLPEDQREVLTLTRFNRLKYAEVGLLLGCSEGAVKLKVFRALQHLRVIYFQLEQI